MNNNLQQNFKNASAVKEHFIEMLRDFQGIRINSPNESCVSPYILSVSFIGIRAEVLLHLLEEANIFVSTGSACSSKDTKDSHVLKAIGLKDNEIKGTIRFSFSEYTSKEEVDYTIEILMKSLRFLRRVKK
jgi:cysteine desulfurase